MLSINGTSNRHPHTDLNKITTSIITTTTETATADNPTIPSTGNDSCLSEDFKWHAVNYEG